MLRKTNKRIFKTIIRPTLLYINDFWILNKNEEKLLEVRKNKILTHVYGGKQVGKGRINQEIMDIYGSPPVNTVISKIG